MTAVAEREVRARVRRALAALSDGPPQPNGALREQHVREAVHGEVWGYQREQVTSNGPVLPDPDRTEQEILVPTSYSYRGWADNRGWGGLCGGFAPSYCS